MHGYLLQDSLTDLTAARTILSGKAGSAGGRREPGVPGSPDLGLEKMLLTCDLSSIPQDALLVCMLFLGFIWIRYTFSSQYFEIVGVIAYGSLVTRYVEGEREGK